MSWPWDIRIALALNGVALALLLYGVLGDWCRQRTRHRRRRCLRCLYDMSKTPGLRCSECGFRTRSERALFGARLGRWTIAGALLLFSIDYGLSVVPAVQERGWLAAVPTTVLVVAAPIDDSAWKRSSWGDFELLEKPVDPMLTELVDRCHGSRLHGWQWRILLSRFFRAHPDQLTNVVRTRDTWPVGAHLKVSLYPLFTWFQRRDDVIVRARIAGSDGPWQELISTAYFGPGARRSSRAFRHDPGDADEVRLEIEILRGAVVINDRDERTTMIVRKGVYCVWRGMSAPITIAGAADEYLTPFHSAKSDKAVLGLEPDLARHPDGDVKLRLRQPGWHIGEGRANWALGACIEVFRGEQMIATGSVVHDLPDPGMHSLVMSSTVTYDLQWLVAPPQIGVDEYRVRLIGDPSVAIYDLDRTSYWAGDVMMPVPGVSPLREWEIDLAGP